jgi:hypothetical protein
MTGIPEEPSTGWLHFLDALEAAAVALREQVTTGARARVPQIPPPPGTAPAELEARGAEVAALLDEVAALVGRHQDEIARKLAATSRASIHQDPRSRQVVGSHLDVLG